jgi:hypothetical protein
VGKTKPEADDTARYAAWGGWWATGVEGGPPILTPAELKQADAFLSSILPPPARSRQRLIAARSFSFRAQLITLIDVARQQNGWSKAELARRAGLNPASVRRLFSAPAPNPTADYLFRLLAALDLDTPWLAALSASHSEVD